MAENTFTEQVKTFYKRLSLVQKLIIGGVVAGLILGTVLLLSSSKPVEMGVLYSNLEPSDAAKIVESLKAKGVQYKLEDNGNTILVDKSQLYDTRIQLAGEGLPSESIVGYELFDKTNLGMSEFVQKLNYRRALEGELARTIGTMDEIKKVRVHLVIPEKTLFKKDEKPPSASVIIHLKSGRSLSKISIEGIQNLVASSVEGLTIDKVTVVDGRGKILSEPPLDNSTVTGLTQTQHDIQRQVEQHYAEKVQSLLDGVLGTENSKVRVNAEIDFTQVEKTITDFDPERQVIRSEQNIQEVSESTDSLSYPTVSQAKNASNVIQNYEISKTVSHIVEGTGNIKRLTVSAIINGVTKVVDENGVKKIEYTPRKQEEIDQLTLAIKNAVGYDPTRNDQISVLNVPFDTSLLEQEIEEQQPVVWYKDKEIIKLIALIAAILITIMLMFALIQSKFVKDRLRIALGLPNPKLLVKEEVSIEEEEEEPEEQLEDLKLDEEDLLLLPAELPEQVLLEGEIREEEPQEIEEETDMQELEALAKSALDVEPQEMTEEDMLKLEIKEKVESFLDEQTENAVKLIKILLQQDIENPKSAKS
ncbi:MAG: flagellar basal-body MS-ring/collar protein FliF [Ignavibacteria bacterium]|nr:flagellar basal-body MS-ring/collar protein FliF [Ignavibacteria bacterium]